MNYIELKIERPFISGREEILIAQLASSGFESFSEEADHILAYIPEKYFRHEWMMESEVLKQLHESGALSINLIEDQNWNAIWESNYQPVTIAGKCLIRAPFHQADPEAELDIIIRPQMAFGTAHHETTAQMAEQLLQLNLEGLQVLDMGCGTGVLGIIASLKGAAHVTAIDNDEWACRNAVENAALNHVTGLKVVQGDATELSDDAYDLILANINKNILLSDMGAYARALRQGGSIFFSGFYEQDLGDIAEAADKKGLIFVKHVSRNNWVVAVFKKQ